MITAGRFNHTGEASVRLEGQTAWGVWLRVDHWRASRGASRFRCGVLCHPVNRELIFHGVGSVVTQFLLPLFADWTFTSVELLPSVSGLVCVCSFYAPHVGMGSALFFGKSWWRQ